MQLISRLLLICLLIISYLSVQAIDERYAAPPLRGSSIAPDSTSMVMDTVYFNPTLKPQQTTFFVKNLITFQIDEAYRYMLPDDFDVTLTFRVHYTVDDGGTPENGVSDDITLHIGYSKYSPYGFKATYIADDWWYKSEIEIISIETSGTLSEFRDALMLTNEILINREYDFLCTGNAVQAVHDTLITTKGELKVWWLPERAADEYDLEWSWVDSAAKANYYKTGSTTLYDPKKIFPSNATRVSITKENYYIPLLFEWAGMLFYRVRAVQIKPNGQRIESVWSSDYTNGLGKFDYRGHDTALNWQAATSFAEEGKRKSVVQYFDGSLKSRQTVTKDNTTDTTIIAETFYDNQGRAVIQVMPSPSLNGIIKYTPGFNQLNGAEYTKDAYDGLLADTCRCRQGAPAMDTVSGAARYYSPNNPLATTGYHKFIPDARGFVFAETRYTPDNTGRISLQGGVADTFQIGKKHETVYTYSAADQEELDALFGTEVGNASHYFKNTVRDANGQVSVSYVDMHGRTIATALAGRPPVKLDTLVSNKSYYISKKLLDSTTNVIKGKVIESSRGLTVTRGGNHWFQYSMLPDSISITDCNDTAICYDCIYDLQITIAQECNDTSKAIGAPIVIKRTNYQLSTACDTISRIPAVDTTINLSEGTYLITKTLTINKQAMDHYRDSVFMVRNTCRTFEQTVESQKALLRTNTQCVPDCDSCRTAIGDWDNFRNNYMQDAGIANSDSVNYINQARIAYNDALLACDQLCNSGLHHTIREQMLADVTPPSGQYANPNNIDQFSIFWSSGTFTQPAYQTTSAEYLTDDGQYDHRNVKSFTQQQFIDEFKSSWADVLLEKHPEYPKLKKFEELAVSNNWDTRFENTETYQAAVDSGFLNPANFTSHPTGSIFNYNSAHRDPLFTDLMPEYKQAMEDSVLDKTHDTSGNAISMWSLATIMAHCADGSTPCLYRYKTNDSAFAIGAGCSADLDMAWKYFREMYLQEKREIIAQILNAEQQQSERFPDLKELYDNHQPNFYDPAMVPTDDMATTATAGRDSLNKFINDNCSAYVNQWWEELKPCGFDSADSARIIPRLLEVCRQGGDSAHLFGSSTVKPSSAYTFRSFDDVLKYYRDSTGKDYNAQCNVYLISAPVAYDQQPVYAEKPVVQKPDSCECATIGALYEQYQNAGIDTSFSDYIYRTSRTRIYQGVLDTLRMACNGQINCSFLKEPLSLPPVLQCGVRDVCVTCVRVDMLYNQYIARFPDAIPDVESEDSLQIEKNKLFERYMNAALGFAKTTGEYLQFKSECERAETSCDTLKNIMNDYIKMRLSDSSRFERNRIVPDSLYTYWASDMYKNGFAHIPDNYVNTMNYGSHYKKNDTLCAGNVFTFVTRVKKPARDTDNSEFVVQVRFHDDEGFKLFGPVFILPHINPTAADTAYMLANSGKIGYLTWYPPTNPILSDYYDWTEIKITHGDDSIWRVYFNDTLVNQLYVPKRINKIVGFQAIFGGKANNGYVDYYKLYDQNGKLQYVEDFEDALQSPSNDPPAFGCADSCQARFTSFYNQRTGSSLTYSQIQDLYSNCGVQQDGCSYDNRLDTLILCGKTEPVFLPVEVTQHNNCDDSTLFAHSTSIVLHDAYRDSLISSFNDRYLAKCLNARYNESFTVYQPISEYHYTLYYYDQAGNLLKTVPPAGVDVSKFAWAAAWRDSVAIARRNDHLLTPNHTLPTQYRYNTLDQVVKQQSPDGGQSEFWYDRLGRLAISQNARQKPSDLYSYTMYDSLGRITEVGQVNNSGHSAMSDAISRNNSTLESWLITLNNKRGQITTTVYDLPYPGFAGVGDTRQIIEQKNLRNRVSYTTITDTGNVSLYNQGTFYTYDILGNVDFLLQDYGSSGYSTTANVMNKNGNRWKKTGYKYDLISGKVNMVMYQYGWRDGFFHRYSYDAENRLTLVETSTDSLVWEKDARYEYYRHGPLARVTFGEQQVQGLDYAYTLQGWLKGINSTGGTDSFDMGGDGRYSSINRYTAKDAIGLTLNYFGNDYTALNGMPFPGYSSHLNDAYRPLYNGNISSSSVYQRKFDYYNSPGGPLIFYNYKYDQLNRLTQQDAHTVVFNTGSGYIDSLPIMGQNLKERIAYDANGNIQKYLRNSITGTPGHMDSLNYFYYAGTNQLKRITDSVPANGFVDGDGNIVDIDGQPDSNYRYDAIGNLIKDSAEKITDIKWNIYGKIQEITKDNGGDITTIKYTYDALGNRISQVVIPPSDDPKYTWYVRDAQGNLLSTYTSQGDESDLEDLSLNQDDVYMYGSSRLGSYKINSGVDDGPDAQTYYGIRGTDRGWKQYELTNHLGNVLATVSDRKFPVPFTSSSLIAYYDPHIVTAQDYYPFGMLSRVALPSGNKSYTFGFNGKMNDNDVKGLGNQQDYGMRIYDGRVGRFLSLDPLQAKYPWFTPYQYAGNSPIGNIDMDGLENLNYNLVEIKKADGSSILGIQSAGKASFNIADLYLDANKHPTSGKLHNLFYKGESIAQFESFQDLKTLTHGKTVAQIVEIGNEIDAEGYQKMLDLHVASEMMREPYNATRYGNGRNPVQNQQLLDEAAQEGTVVSANRSAVRATGSPAAAEANTANNTNDAKVERPTVQNSKTVEEWKGAVDYSHLKEPKKVGAGLETTRAQRARILEHNKKVNGGIIKSDLDGSVLDKPTQNITLGQKANMNQAEVDHIQERVEGGSNSNGNQRVISKKQNVDKEANRKKAKE
jgi:RHS repeat-associated protein